MHKYEIIIYWSDEDELYVAEVSELRGCMAHGETYDQALQSIKEAMELWLEDAGEYQDPIPEPLPRLLLPAWERPQSDKVTATAPPLACGSGLAAARGFGVGYNGARRTGRAARPIARSAA